MLSHTQSGQQLASIPPAPNLVMSQEQLANMMQAIVQQQLQQQFGQSNKPRPPQKRKRKVSVARSCTTMDSLDDDAEGSSGGDSDQEGTYVQQTAQTARRILWQRGHQGNVPSKVEQLISAATVTCMADAWKPLCEIGFAIIDDMTEVFAPKVRYTMEQRDYIHKCACHLYTLTLSLRHHNNPLSTYMVVIVEQDEGLEVVFEGVNKNSAVDHLVPHFDHESANPRLQLEANEVRPKYTALYEEQLRNVIEGYDVLQGEEQPINFNSTLASRTKGRASNKNMSAASPPVAYHVAGLFPKGSDAGTYTNWKAQQTILKGGTNIQHPHSDNAIVGSYEKLDVFPFVCIHGFGVEEFTLWLLPNPFTRAYGFEHRFKAKNMLLMRGDFVHAGGPGRNPRAHMEFFPRESAGWNRKRSFWMQKNVKVQPTFLWQKPTYPFGFPSAAEPDHDGDIVITYPPQLTKNLLKPFSKKQCNAETILYIRESKRTKQIRRAECAKVQAESW